MSNNLILNTYRNPNYIDKQIVTQEVTLFKPNPNFNKDAYLLGTIAVQNSNVTKHIFFVPQTYTHLQEINKNTYLKTFFNIQTTVTAPNE